MKNIALTLLIMITCLTGKSYAQTYFDNEKQYTGAGSCGIQSKKLSSLAKLSDADILKAFETIKTSGMEFGYPQGGCQQRAEMMSAILHNLKIDHAKIWIFAPSNLQAGSDTSLEIKDPNGLTTDGMIKWGYHVAPIVLSQSGNTLVIDPSINKNAPTKINDWFTAMKNSNASMYTILDSNQYFFFTDNNRFNGCFYKYEPMAGFSTMYDKCNVERELAINDVAIFFKKKLDNGYKDPKNQIKTLVSNVNNMINFFAAADRKEAFLQGISIRDLLINHSDLMNEAAKYYTDRLTFWINTKSKLK